MDKGVLKGYLHSLETAARLGAIPNGAARADGFVHRPIVRMSNTSIQPGDRRWKNCSAISTSASACAEDNGAMCGATRVSTLAMPGRG